MSGYCPECGLKLIRTIDRTKDTPHLNYADICGSCSVLEIAVPFEKMLGTKTKITLFRLGDIKKV